mgnify:CR=1 FL=1
MQSVNSHTNDRGIHSVQDLGVHGPLDTSLQLLLALAQAKQGNADARCECGQGYREANRIKHGQRGTKEPGDPTSRYG